MKEKLTKVMKKKAKGFTLVELIVVMIILAILAALLVPSMTGYIDKARDRAAIVEARQVLVACQTVASENYYKDASMTHFEDDQIDEILTLAEIKSDATSGNGTFNVNPVIEHGKIKSFKYKTTSGVFVTYTAANSEKFVVSTT